MRKKGKDSRRHLKLVNKFSGENFSRSYRTPPSNRSYRTSPSTVINRSYRTSPNLIGPIGHHQVHVL